MLLPGELQVGISNGAEVHVQEQVYGVSLRLRYMP